LEDVLNKRGNHTSELNRPNGQKEWIMKMTFARTAMATVVALVTAIQGYGQQSTPPPATDYTPAAPSAITSQPATQTGTAPATSVETSPGIPAPVDQTRDAARAATDANISAERAPATIPPPAQSRAPRGDANITVRGDDRVMAGEVQGFNRAPARGELGVWLVESPGAGVQIRRITEGSAADQAGLQPGDVILEINGEGAGSARGVANLIQSMPAGETAFVEFERNGLANQVEIVLQPMRARHNVGFRGDPTLREMNVSTDLESRTARLEEQLALVLQELRQIRQDLALRDSGAPPTAVGGGGVGTATATGYDAGATTPPATTAETDTTFGAEPAATAPAAAGAAAAAATEAAADDAFDADADTAAPAATPPQTSPATPPAEDDPFGGTSTDEPAAEEPAATEANATEEPASEDATTEEPAAEADADAAAPAEEGAATEDAGTESGTDDLFE
jgi:membrane-associated protease RseP (regulator of RpoE activity)